MELTPYALAAWKALRLSYHYSSRAAVNAYQRYYAWKHRPPTAQQTATARAHMHTALSLAQDYINWDDKRFQQHGPDIDAGQLVPAAKALRKARRLDPNATIEIPAKDKGPPVRMDQDMIAGDFCYYEACLYYDHAHYIDIAPIPSEKIMQHREINQERKEKCREYYRKAYKAINRGIRLSPNNVLYLQQGIKIYGSLASWYVVSLFFPYSIYLVTRLHQLKRRALAIDPHNPETLKIT